MFIKKTFIGIVLFVKCKKMCLLDVSKLFLHFIFKIYVVTYLDGIV